MGRELEMLCAQGLSFFGVTNRLISHKLKNKLALMSETSGLMNDLMDLWQDSKEVDRARLRSLTESIIEEVGRANAIVGYMNAFAHSVDKVITDVEITQAVGLIIELAQLQTYAKKTKLRFVKTNAYTVHTSPFFIGNLIYHVLVFALSASGPEEEIRVSVHPDAGGFKISFSGIATDAAPQFATENIALLAKALCADISFDPSLGELNIVLPQRIGESVIQNLSLDE